MNYFKAFLIFTFLYLSPTDDLIGQVLLKDRFSTIQDIAVEEYNGSEIAYLKKKLHIKLNNLEDSTQYKKYLTNFGTISSFDKLGWAILDTNTDNVIDLINTLKIQIPDVIFEPLYVGEIGYSPNDPDLSKQWHLNNIGQSPTNGTTGADILVKSAWDITTGGNEVVIAILDTGIPMQNGQLSHPDLQNNSRITLGPDHSTSGDPTVRDLHGHGAHVTGIASAETNNGNGISGISWDSEILAIQSNRDNGTYTSSMFKNSVISASDYAQQTGKRVVINFSSGGYSASQAYIDAIDYAASKNVIIVTITHNQGNQNFITYPGKHALAYENVIAVGATDHNDIHSSFSNAGSEITLTAPGGYGSGDYRDIYSTLPNYSVVMNGGLNGFNQNYDYVPGTSMSAPQVTGTIALMLSVNQNLSPSEVKTILTQTAEKVQGMNGLLFTSEYGHGRLNALKAVYQAERLAVANQMVSFKSLNEDASGDNSGRRTVYEPSSGSYHVVFASGSEIVYYKKLPWMTQSPKIITSLQNSNIGKNTKPVITIDKNGVLHIAWQKKRYGSTDPSTGNAVYDIYTKKSTNGGNSWVSEKLITTVTQNYEPEPTIMTFDSPNENQLMLVYRANGLQSLIYNSSSDTWDPWNSTVSLIPNTNLSTTDFSGIGSARFGNIGFNIVYRDNSNNAIKHTFHDDPYHLWSANKNLSSVVPGSATHHSPSIGTDKTPSTAVHVAWSRTTGSGSSSYDHKIIHRWTSDVNSWPNVYHTTYYQQQLKPTITGVGTIGNYDAYLVWEITGNAGIAKQYFNGSSWNSPSTVTSNGVSPSLSVGGTQSKFFYTEEVGPNFNVKLSNQTLMKSLPVDPNFNPEEMIYKRSISFIDTSGAYLEFIVHDVNQGVFSGTKSSVSMKSFHQDSIDLSIEKALDAFSIEKPTELTNTALDFNLQIRGNNVSSIFKDGKLPKLLVGNVNESSGRSSSLITLSSTLSDNDSEDYIIEIPSESLTEDLASLLKLESYNFKETVIASLGHINAPKESNSLAKSKEIIIGDEIEKPSDFQLTNYPNPFNPTTEINFSLPESGEVSLKVYDMLGREVSTIVSSQMSAGTHSVTFDASFLSSGIYIYRLTSGSTTITKRMTLIK